MRIYIFIYLFIATTVLCATSVESQLGINVGMVSTKNSQGSYFENPTLGVSLQYNNYVIMPRVDLEYVNLKDEKANSFLKGSINGVYEFENSTSVVPYILAGAGYEDVQGGEKDVLESHPFIQGGGGVSIELVDEYRANIEGKIIQILSGTGEENEAIITAGISIPLGVKKFRRKVKVPMVQPIVTPVVAPVVAPTRIVYVNNNTCSIKTDLPDLDRDGVEDRIDQCPATPCNFSVDNYGCPIRTTLKINFEINSARITEASRPKIERFARFLLKNRGSRVRIIGHTDSLGSVKKNLALSKERAYAVVRMLLKLGVSSARLFADGAGESMPIASNATPEGRAKNRRIEAELIYPRGRE
jgi:OOP family OmpA-OmpF porin